MLINSPDCSIQFVQAANYGRWTDRQELQKRQSELWEPQGRQTEVRETVMICKGNGVSCQKLHVLGHV